MCYLSNAVDKDPFLKAASHNLLSNNKKKYKLEKLCEKRKTFVLNSYKNLHMVEQISDQIHIAFGKGFGIFFELMPYAAITTLGKFKRVNVLKGCPLGD